jgi:hypothetical protein
MAEQIIGAPVISEGSSEELDNLGRSLIKQSRLSASAAAMARCSAALQGFMFLAHGP